MVNVKHFIDRVGIRNAEELADKLGISADAVYSWKGGNRNPTYEVMVKLKRLGMTDMELYGEVFPSQMEAYKSHVMQSVSRFLEDIGINTDKEKMK